MLGQHVALQLHDIKPAHLQQYIDSRCSNYPHAFMSSGDDDTSDHEEKKTGVRSPQCQGPLFRGVTVLGVLS
jgi:hypothetical protein